MFKIKRTFIILLVVIFLGIFFGCKSKNNNNDDISGGEIVVIRDKTDTVLGAYNIDTLNPIATKSKSSQRIMNIIYESLFSYNEELVIEPVLAESYILSEDGKSITIMLKNDVKWEDGSPFSASDVIFTLSKMISCDGIYSKTANKIKSYTAIDDKTVLIEFYTPEIDFAYLLTIPIMKSGTVFATDDSFVPIGTGSYKLSSRTSTELFLEPNPLWHGGHISEKKIIVKILKDELTATNALNVKEIDAVALENYNQDTNIPKLNSTSKTVSTNNMVFLGFNAESSLMSQNIRSAICSIVNKQKLLDNNAYGKGKVCSLSINPVSWASKLTENLEVDYDEMIENDGYKLINGIYSIDEQPFEARILVNSDNQLRCNIAQGVCDMLNGFGLKAYIDAVEYNEYIRKIESDDFDMFIGEVEVLPNLNPGAMLDSADNYFNFDTSYLDEIKNTLYGVSERDVIKKNLEVYKSRFYSNPPYLPLYFKSDVIIYGSYVSGIEPPNLFDSFKNIENWFFYDKDGNEQNKAEDEEK